MNQELPAFKYALEHALVVRCDWAGVLSPASLESVGRDPDVPNANIYMIAVRPRITIVPSECSSTSDRVVLTFRSKRPEGEEDAEARIEFENCWESEVLIESAAPHSVVEVMSESGDFIIGMDSGTFLAWYLGLGDPTIRVSEDSPIEGFLDLEIVYVGQSQQEGGAVPGRLQSHEKLQRILADVARDQPHLEVQIVLMSFGSYYTIGAMATDVPLSTDAASKDHLRQVSSFSAPQGEITAIAEAGLIRYFQPKYNKLLRESFPSPKHSSYSAAYVLDFSALGFEFETLTTIKMRTGSECESAAFIHTALFSLVDPKVRRRFLDVRDDMDLGRDLFVVPGARVPHLLPST